VGCEVIEETIITVSIWGGLWIIVVNVREGSLVGDLPDELKGEDLITIGKIYAVLGNLREMTCAGGE